MLAAARINANNDDERALAVRAMQAAKLKVVLHIETPKQPSKLFGSPRDTANIKKQLKQRVRAVDPHPIVVSRDTLTNTQQAPYELVLSTM